MKTTKSEFSKRQRRSTAKKLFVLADFLSKLPPARFDYTKWVGEDWKGAQDLSCGTTACALGWAATMPIFRRLGLRLEHHTDAIGAVVYCHCSEQGSNIEAAMRVFGLTYGEATFLFVPSIYIYASPYNYASPPHDATPQAVAEHIRAVASSIAAKAGASRTTHP